MSEIRTTTMSFFFLLSIPLLLSTPFPLNNYSYDTSYRIDCGGKTNFTGSFNDSWLSDRFYTGGSPGYVSQPHLITQLQEQTLRFFPISFGKKNCYIVKVPSGRYYIRTYTVYDNYDGEMHTPSFDTSVEGTLVFSWRSPWPEAISTSGAYSDLFAFVNDGEADICFYSIATDPPVIGSLEIVQVDPLSYDSSATGNDVILVNYGRFTCGSNPLGSGFSNDTDLFGRAWQSDDEFRLGNMAAIKTVSTTRTILSTERPPNYFPMQLYQTAVTVTGGEALEYQLPVDAKSDYMVWFHFAEIDSSITKAGQRVFDVLINGRNITRIDIYKSVGSFVAFDWYQTVNNLNSTILSVKFVPVVGDPLISGLENYALVSRDLSTVPEQVSAIRALKESLRIPDRMGWNGDPCAPPSWDAWEGVTCHPNAAKSGLVVSQIDLGSQGLKGYISEQISLLTNLVSLNLSSNSLEGTIPAGLGLKSLVQLDLSSNMLSGSIPDSLSSASLQLVLLNDNQLEGKVPDKLYSIGLHGGAIDLFGADIVPMNGCKVICQMDPHMYCNLTGYKSSDTLNFTSLSGNKGLCGVPSLPACPIFWGKDGLSTSGKIAIGLSCVVFLSIILLVIYICFIRKGENYYDFGLPQDLVSLAAKRNRYHRQKSLMLMEMETQSANKFPVNPH